MTDESNQPNSKHLDHIIPVVMGGTHTMGNVRIICRTCNLSRPKDGSDLDGHQPTLWAQSVKLTV
jgi:5-methylcytosine-specific restriction endonuclease McrA